jgi:hypothetical protein
MNVSVVEDAAQNATVANGTSRRFVTTQQFGRYWGQSEHPASRPYRTGFMSTRPSQLWLLVSVPIRRVIAGNPQARTYDLTVGLNRHSETRQRPCLIDHVSME